MAKKKIEKTEDDFYTLMAKETGGRLLAGAGASRYFIDTGNLALNWICSGKFLGGGYPTGITEIYGPPASSKSLLVYTAMGNVQKQNGYTILLDLERSSNEGFAMVAGHVDPSKLIVQYPLTLEDIHQLIVQTVNYIRKHKGPDVPILFGLDSIGVAMCRRELAESKIPLNATKEQMKGMKEQPGERAKAAGKMFRQVNPFLDDNNASLIVLNQTRASIGTYGQDETTAGGGKALPFYANCRLRTAAAKQIEHAKLKRPIGVNVRFRNKKSRSFIPFLSTENVQLYFDKGINPLGGLLSVLINAGRVVLAGKGVYQVVDPWAEGKEIKFRASGARNDVAAEVLYGCPSLIDATSEQQVRDYLGIFAEAVDQSLSEDVEERDLEADDISDDDAIANSIGTAEEYAEE